MFSFIHANESAGRIQTCWPMVYLLLNRGKTLGFTLRRWLQKNFVSMAMSSSVKDTSVSALRMTVSSEITCLICFCKFDTYMKKVINMKYSKI